MRIFSKFHDYYDSCLKFGIDPKCVYKRKEYEALIPKSLFHDDIHPWGLGSSYFVRFILGFCGKIYPVIQVYEHYFYNIEQLTAAIEANYKQYKTDNYYRIEHWGAKDIYERYYSERKGKSQKDKYKEWIDNVNSHQDDYKQIFIENKSPIFIFNPYEYYYKSDKDNIPYYQVHFNCSLKQYEFFKVKDPFTAFQEIEMYLSNNFWVERPIPEISNNDMIEAKGFHLKTSFRKGKRL